MNIDKNWDKLLSRTRNDTEQKFKQKKDVKNIDSIVKELVLNADVDDDNIWNYIYYLKYLKSGNDYIAFNEYINILNSAVNSQAVPCSLTIYCF